MTSLYSQNRGSFNLKRGLVIPGKNILVTGVTGMMGRDLALALAGANTVYGVGRLASNMD